ncbi:hypothetical protein OG311_37450 [Streptomyces sp. NBC_01343]|uniref:hypothetical protein n=1 Tax=Streptomyces sp. NBC_01343 TaxID=2903832 RepID=UPI002E11E37E|nr:hypothetical protein OG311_37450 [Streptomyces sp. NBC_01343]
MWTVWYTCAGLLAAACLFRWGFWIWAQNPEVTRGREPDGPLTLYEAAALNGNGVQHVCRTLVEGMVISGALDQVDTHFLRVPERRGSVDGMQAALLDRLQPGGCYSGYSLRILAHRLDEPGAVVKGARQSGLITRDTSDGSLNMVVTLTALCGACGLFVMLQTRSFLPVAMFGGLVLLGWGVTRVLPWRDDVASRRGARMKAAVGATSGPRPALPPGLVLDDEAHARFALVALHGFGSHQLFDDPSAPRSRPPADEGPVIHEGPGLGGL